MTSWVITIDKAHPQHWAVAKKHGFWDMTGFHKVGLGDTIYFWQAGGSLVSQCVATTAAYPVTPDTAGPWEDSGARIYRGRFHFDVVSDEPVRQPTWGDLQSEMVKEVSLQAPRAFDDPADEARLASCFRPTDELIQTYRDELREAELAAMGFDLRSYDMRAIARRQGQQAFRNALIEAYAGKCAVTGATTVDVLEAAHISPHKGTQTNKVRNGLLLRSDIHTLFDLRRLSVTPDFVVRVHPDLLVGDYAHLDHKPLESVPNKTSQPHAKLLEQHNAQCDWLDA